MIRNKYTFEELKKWTKEELIFWININISPFINTKKRKEELIQIILTFQ